tara:strand:- start:833 stop:1108 length:276 start_codon:yes stop_codon:yes gene_type:complete
MVELITNRLIDSVWTIVAVISEVDKTARILRYDRENVLGYELEKECRHGFFKEKEGEGRIVESLFISIDTYGDEVVDKYKVVNPKNIFSYK